MDVITSHRVTDNSSHTENASGSLVNQMAATFSDIRSQATQLSDTQTRSLESARLASFVENHSAAIRSHATQEFVEYVKQKVPDADAILTDVSSPQAREKREQLAAQFVQERMMPQLEAAYRKGQQLTTQEAGSSEPTGVPRRKSGVISIRASMRSFRQLRLRVPVTMAVWRLTLLSTIMDPGHHLRLPSRLLMPGRQK